MARRENLLQKAKTSTRQEVLIGENWLDVGMMPLSYEVYWGTDTDLLLQDKQMTIEDTPDGVVIARTFPKGTPIYPGDFLYPKYTTNDTVDIRRFSQPFGKALQTPSTPFDKPFGRTQGNLRTRLRQAQDAREEVAYQGPPPPPNVIKAAKAAKATHIRPDGKFIYTTKNLDVHWAEGTSTARWHDKEGKFGYWGSLPGGIPADAVEISSLKKDKPEQMEMDLAALSPPTAHSTTEPAEGPQC